MTSTREVIKAYVYLAKTGNPIVDYEGIIDALLRLTELKEDE